MSRVKHGQVLKPREKVVLSHLTLIYSNLQYNYSTVQYIIEGKKTSLSSDYISSQIYQKSLKSKVSSEIKEVVT